MSASEYYHRDGTPSETYCGSWDESDPDCKRVASTTVRGVEVSTVFLCLDHSWSAGPPVIFETMIFNGVLDGDCERYSTEAEALAGHEAAVRKVRRSLRWWWRLAHVRIKVQVRP